MGRNIQMMRNNDFVVFILTHGRSDRVFTYNTIRRSGYSGRIVIVIDNEDKTADRYKKIYGDEVYTFDKKAVSETFDEGDNFKDRRSIVYARNAVFGIAKELGIRYFMQLDDDYTGLCFRINDKGQYPSGRFAVKSRLDPILDILIDYYKAINKTGDVKSIAIAQGLSLIHI